MAARFPGFDVLREVHSWDPLTAGTVLARVGLPPPLRFFTPAEEATADALFAQLLDMREEPRIPVTRVVDARLAEMQTDGWRYEDMPEDPLAWRETLAALNDDARVRFGLEFARCRWVDQSALVQSVQDLEGKPWHGFPATHVWSLWTRYACTVFYADPRIWNEIGFGGPAYPRGYKELGLDRREPWEVADQHPDDPVKGT